MKKLFYIFTLLLCPNMVFAASCEAEDKAELLTYSSLINVNYEEQTGYYTGEEVGYPEGLTDIERENYLLEYNYFQINILNLTDDFYAVITNNVTEEVIKVDSSDSTDGLYSFIHGSISYVTTYTIKIYGSGDSNCEDEHLATKYLIIPKYNVFSTYAMCTDYPDEAVCQKYTTTSTYTDSYVLEYLSALSFNSSDTQVEEDTTVFDYIMDDFVYILIGGISMVGVIGIIIFIQKKRSDLK